MAKNIGATLSLKDGDFFTNLKSASTATEGFKNKLEGAVGKTSKFGKALNALKPFAAAAAAGITAASGYAVKLGDDFKQASNSIGAATGISTEQLNGMNDVMKNIYAQNYGENFQDIADAISTVTQNSKLIDPSAIQETTTNALALRDTFGFEIPESMRAVNMLMDQFGISSTEAFNLIVQGAQNGLDKNGDLLDTINEYSVHFRQSGISAEGMFNSLINGAATGTFSVDKLGDAVKEFGIRVKDGTGDEAFEALGLSADKMKQAFVDGGESGQQAFKQITGALFSMDDKVQQNLLGVQLFGIMWEDLGADGIKALTDIEGEFDRTYDSMSKLKDIKYDNIGSALQGLKRTVETNILLPIGKGLTPIIGDFVNGLTSKLQNTDVVSGITNKLENLASSGILESFSENMLNVVSKAIDGISNLYNHWDKIKVVIGIVGAAMLTYKGVITACTVAQKAMTAAEVIGKGVKLAKKVVQSGLINSTVIYNGLMNSSTMLHFKCAAATTKDTIALGLHKGAAIAGGIATKALAAGQWLLNAAFVASPIGWIVLGITALVAIFVVLWKKCEGFRNFWISAWEGIKNISSVTWGVIKNIFTTGFDALKSTVSEKLNNIKNAYESHGGGMKGIFFAAIEGVKSYYTAGFTFIDNLTGGKLTSIKDKMISTFTAAKDKVSDIFTSLKNKIKDVWDGIKGLIKTPHIVQDGTISIAGISTPIPKLGIRWYANGGIMTRPTAFAYSGATAHVGGESGAEAILPLSQFWNKLRQFTLESRTAATAPATNNTVTNYINVYANGKDADTVVNEIVYKLKKVLDNL